MKRDSPTAADDDNSNNHEQEPSSSEKMGATTTATTSSTGAAKDAPAAAKESAENDEQRPIKKIKLENEEEEEEKTSAGEGEEKAPDASGNNKDAATTSGDGDGWDAFLERLTRFKEHHGHCNPPLESEEEPGLGEWVAKQRDLYKGTDENEKLTDYQVEKLSQVGFDWQPRNPRHLQWETRFAQLQAFKKKYGHVQVPIGWSENVQLANWVSKQRQEYKNLLRGRATRLDENRIRLLNSVGFAWQLQRGGRRRQLKARSKSSGAEGDNHSSDGEAKGEGGAEDDGPCILPGEVLIGQGASNPLSPDADGMMAISKSGKKARVNNKSAAGASMDGPGASPLQQSYMQGSMLAAAASPMGMGYARGAGGGGGAQGGGGGGQPNNELLDIMLARNALFQNFQRPPGMGAGGHHPMAYQMLGAGAYSGLSAYNGFQQAAAANQHAQFLAAAQQAGRNPLFQPPMFPFSGAAAGAGGQFPGAAGFNFQGGAGNGGGAGWHQGASGEESKLGGGTGGGGGEGDPSGMQGYENFRQQQQGGQMFQGNVNMHRAGRTGSDPPVSGGTSPVDGFHHQNN